VSMERHKIAHFERGTSNKVYIVCIRELPNSKFQVLGKWGRRDCQTMQLMVKGEFDSLVEAQQEMKSLFRVQTRKGYVDIESAGYTGDVALVDMERHMEAEPAMPSSRASMKKVRIDDEELVRRRAEERLAELKAAKERREEEEAKRFKSGRKLVVKCINNLGLEHLFEMGSEYNAVTIDDREMLMVADMTGMDVEVFAERFHEVFK